MIIYAPFESPNRGDSKYGGLDNVWIVKMSKKCKKPIEIPTIDKSGFGAIIGRRIVYNVQLIAKSSKSNIFLLNLV